MKICTHPSIPLPTAIHEVPAGKCAVKLWEVNLKGFCLEIEGMVYFLSEGDKSSAEGWRVRQ